MVKFFRLLTPASIKSTAEYNFYNFLGNQGLKGEPGICPESCDLSSTITRLQRDLQGIVFSKLNSFFCILIILYL